MYGKITPKETFHYFNCLKCLPLNKILCMFFKHFNTENIWRNKIFYFFLCIFMRNVARIILLSRSQSFQALCAYADNANAYAHSAIFLCGYVRIICGLCADISAYMRLFYIHHICGNSRRSISQLLLRFR